MPKRKRENNLDKCAFCHTHVSRPKHCGLYLNAVYCSRQCHSGALKEREKARPKKQKHEKKYLNVVESEKGLTDTSRRVLGALLASTPLPPKLARTVLPFLVCRTMILIEESVIGLMDLGDLTIRPLAGVREDHPDNTGCRWDGVGEGARFEVICCAAYHAPSETIFVGEGGCVRRVTLDGRVTTLWNDGDGDGSAVGSMTIANNNLLFAHNESIFIVPVTFETRPRVLARHPHPQALTSGPAGIFFGDSSLHCVFKLSLDGRVEHIAGCAVRGHRDGPAKSAMFDDIWTLSLEGDQLYACQLGGALAVIDLTTRTVKTLAGHPGDSPFDCIFAALVEPYSGTVFTFESDALRTVNPHTGLVKTFLRRGRHGLVCDDGARMCDLLCGMFYVELVHEYSKGAFFDVIARRLKNLLETIFRRSL